jgi:HK97 family phage major capsid protein
MLRLHEIKQRRAAIEGEMRTLYDGAATVGEDLTGEKLERWSTLDTELTELRDQQHRAETRDALDRGAEGRPLDQRGTGGEDGTAWALKPEQRMAQYVARTTGQAEQPLSIGRAVVGMVTGNWRDAELERREMATTTGATGGFLMPASISASIIDLARNATVLIQAGALTIPMQSKDLRVVKIATDPTAAWRAEGATIAESDGAFEAVNMQAHSLAALVRVNAELMDDVPMFASTLDGMLAAALGLELDRVGLYGLGAGQPLGLRNDPYVNQVSMGVNGAALSDYDPFLDLILAVEQANGSLDTLIVAPRTKSKAAKLVTGIASDKTKLAPPADYTALQRLVSNQVSITETQGSSNVASTAFVGGFQNSGFGIRQNVTIEASRVSGTAFEKNQVMVRAILRADFVAFRGSQLGRLIGIL